jgi:arylsulfatase
MVKQLQRTLASISIGFLVSCTLALVGSTATAQQITGTPGAPDATITIDGHVLPPPPQAFGGDIGLNADQSKPYWPARVVPPKGAPNILLILTDDVGFAAPSTSAA